MIFWILAACLTAAVAAVLLAPLARPARVRSAAGGNDITVYRDQLSELDRDVEAGLLVAAEAEVARAEIARRLLAAARASDDPERQPAWGLRRAASGLVVVLVPVLALGAYLTLGAPGLPAAPLAAREAGAGGDPELAKLVEKAESHLHSNPGDGRGWDVLAPIYLRTGRLSDAEIAFRNAIRLLGSTADRQAGLGETLAMENQGQLTDAAKAAFEKARALAPDDPRPAFFLAMGLAQEGRREDAVAAFRALEAKAPRDAPWLPAVKQQIAALGSPADTAASDAESPGAPASDAAAPPPPGNPSAADIAAAQDMSTDDRLAMIKGMVGRLDTELRRDPRNMPGWKRLIRSYMVLNDPEKARDALTRALAVFPADSPDGKALVAMAGEIGLDAKKDTP